MSQRSQRTGGGYLLNDNTASGGKKEEADILCCKHCQKILFLPPDARAEENRFCRRCNAPICGHCATKMLTEGCSPFQKWIDAEAEAGYRRAQNLRAMGYVGGSLTRGKSS
jgi:hypothetical protein